MPFGESIEETFENYLEMLSARQKKNIENRLIYMQFSETLITHWMVKVVPYWLTLDLGLYINKKYSEYN